ncbi:MAG TPA: alpha/beta hydrolase [Pseudonocardiaceae bacterium]|nr:alpha/beta hydrolase [Pseudonocardiaceae bacterium]
MRDSLPVMEQTMVRVRGRMLSWVDFGGVGPTVLVLHGSFGRGAVFAPVADRLQGAARVVALDQRGHGLSDHGGPYTRAEFVADAAAVIHRLGSDPVVVLGHSLGGITAYQLAARHPELVRALIVEDVGAVMRQPGVPHPVLDVCGWPHSAPTREALAEAIRAQGVPDVDYFLRSAVAGERGWRLLFDYDGMMAIQHHGLGDWWSDWLGSTCPALLLHGRHSTPSSSARRPASAYSLRLATWSVRQEPGATISTTRVTLL